MKAISLWQPYATLVAIQAKQYETRSWAPSYTGPLAIHAAKRWTRDQRELTARFDRYLDRAGWGRGLLDDLPFGAFVATAEIWSDDIFQAEKIRDELEVLELEFGDYGDGRFAWRLSEVMSLWEPVPCRGYQKLWNVPPEMVARMRQKRISNA